MRASTTDDNAAAGKIIGGFVSVIYFLVYQGTPIDDNDAGGGNQENLSKILNDTVH